MQTFIKLMLSASVIAAPIVVSYAIYESIRVNNEVNKFEKDREEFYRSMYNI